MSDVAKDSTILEELTGRANKLSNILTRIEKEVEEIDPKALSREDLLDLYSLVSKNQMNILEFVRKMMLLPSESDENLKVKALVDRLLALSEADLLKIEKQIEVQETI